MTTGDPRKLDSREVRDSDADDELEDDGGPYSGEEDDRPHSGKEDQDDAGRPLAEGSPHDESAAKGPTPALPHPSSSPLPSIPLRSVVSAQIAPRTSIPAAADTVREHVASYIEGRKEKIEATVRAILSTQDSVSSQSGSDSQNPVAKIEKHAKASLHQIEVATNIRVTQKYRGALIGHSLTLAGRDTLESFRQACCY